MIVEEWRLHSSVFGGLMFALLPALVAFFSAAAALSLPVFSRIVPMEQVVLLAHYLFAFFGLNVGGFGLMGREFMNRRFGQASLIAYSSRSLPVSERRIFFSFLVKDVLFYFALWILPCVAGLAIVSPFLGIPPVAILHLLLTLSLAFLTGLSAVFFLSTLYAHSQKLLIGTVLAAAAAALLTGACLNLNVLWALPPYRLFRDLSAGNLLASLALAIVPAALSLAFLNVDYPEKKRTYRNALDGLARRMPWAAYAPFMAKDCLDLSRSEGGLGKIVFSFLLPIALIGVLLFAFLPFVPALQPLPLFALFLGIITSTVYNWLTEYDLFASYAFLPVQVSTVIRSKLASYALFNAIPLLILAALAIGTGDPAPFLPVIATFVSLSAYAVAVIVYLTGLHPNILLYNARVFGQYVAALAPLLLAFIFLSLLSPYYLTAGLALLPLSAWILQKSYRKWDAAESLRF